VIRKRRNGFCARRLMKREEPGPLRDEQQLWRRAGRQSGLAHLRSLPDEHVLAVRTDRVEHALPRDDLGVCGVLAVDRWNTPCHATVSDLGVCGVLAVDRSCAKCGNITATCGP